MLFLFKIGFLPIRFWDILDILIVGYLMYQIFKLLRGSLAFNIFIGVITLFAVWWLVNELKMDLLAVVLNQFVPVGVTIIIIIFQPEVRRFLLFLGNNTLRQRSNFLGRIIDRNFEGAVENTGAIDAIKAAILRMSRHKVGALIVLSKSSNLEGLIGSGVNLDAQISAPLIESIFNKESPLHDGAMIITSSKIQAASCILPVSENTKLPKSAGLRHRAAVGITERAQVAAFIVSEQNGYISFAHRGNLQRKLNETQLEKLLKEHF